MRSEEFFGREDIKEIFEKRLRGFREGYRQNIAVLGDELIGKSSVVLNFFSSFQDNIIVPIYLEIRQEEEFFSFLKRFVCTLLYNFLQNSGIALKNDYDFLIHASEKFIPNTIRRIVTLCEQAKRSQKVSEAFFELLAIIDIFSKETSKLCVIILDEFQHLEKFKIKNFYKEWGKTICLQKNVMYILISSCRRRAETILQEDLSLLFGNFEIIEIKPFDIRCSHILINQKFTPFFIEENFRKFIIHFTGGHPFYLKIICDSIIQSARSVEKNIIDSEVFVEGIVRALSDRWSVLNKNFLAKTEQIIDRGLSRNCQQMLTLVADGFNRIKDLRLNLEKGKNKIVPEINNLIAHDVITRSGDFYIFNDRLYNFWLKFVYKETISGNPLMEQEFNLGLRNKIIAEIKTFIENNEKDILERTIELFYNFDDESIVVDKKRLKLKHFYEIKPLRFNGEHIKEGILGRSSDIVWVTAFKNNTCLNEDDVLEFSRECRKFRSKTQKRFIIISEDIDVNARLLAKEVKIITWNLNNLNLLMDFYGKPRIIK